MIQYLKKLSGSSGALKAVGIYTFSNFFTKAVSFASLPLFTYILDKKDFGVISIFSSSIGLLMPFVSLSIIYSTSTDFFKMEKKQFASFISSTAIFPFIMMVLSIAVFYFFFPFFKKNFGFHPLFVWLLPLVTYSNFLFEQNLALIRNNNDSKLFLLLNVIKIILELGIALLLIRIIHFGWQGRVFGIAVSFFCCGAFAIYYIFRNGYFSKTFNFDNLKQELLFSLPALAIQLSVIYLNVSDRFFINYYYGSDRTGLYSIAATFASVIFVFNSALTQYVFPQLFAALSKGTDTSYIKKVFIKYCLLMVAGSAALALFTFLCYKYLLNHNYYSGLKYFFILLIAYLVWAITYFFYAIFQYFKEKGNMLILAFLSIAVSAALNAMFIRSMQETGATIAVLLSYSVVFVLTLFLNRKRIRSIFFYSKQ